jgi:ATP-dependent protease HslVU (ClpYQ) peptidase subunit
MTVIVGLVEEKKVKEIEGKKVKHQVVRKVWMGGDSMVTLGNRSVIRSTSKIYKRGEFLIGSAGLASSAQVLAYGFTFPPIIEGQDQITYLINEFSPAFRKYLKNLGLSKVKDNQERIPNNILIGFRGKVFSIDGALGVLECVDGYDAIGSGEEFALGVLHVLKDSKEKPEDIIKKSLEAAAYHNPYVAPPFEVISGAEYISDD